jgi:hypothetical protein
MSIAHLSIIPHNSSQFDERNTTFIYIMDEPVIDSLVSTGVGQTCRHVCIEPKLKFPAQSIAGSKTTASQGVKTKRAA